MPASCTVCGATKKSNKIQLFHFALICQKTAHLHEISKRRRHEWLRALRKTEDDLTQTGTVHYICSNHFKSGKPAKIQDVTDPDWIPSLNLDPPTPSDIKMTSVSKSDSKREPPIKPERVHVCNIDPSQKNASLEREVACLKKLLKLQEAQIHYLQSKLRSHEMDENTFAGNDLKTQFYTGFATYKCFSAFASYVTCRLPHKDFPGVTKTEMLILVLTKLRLNLPLAYMALRFEIPFEIFKKMFTTSVRQLADHLNVSWPSTRIIPKFLKHVAGEQLAAILDILELELDRSSGTFMSIKFLIAYTPSGQISFVSRSFSGVSTDKFIVNNSGLLKKLNLNDLVVALRGHLNQDIVARGCIRDRVYLYGLGTHGLVPLQLNQAALGDAKTGLTGIMDQLTTTYGFLSYKQPDVVIEDSISFLSKAVMLCAALHNLILPV